MMIVKIAPRFWYDITVLIRHNRGSGRSTDSIQRCPARRETPSQRPDAERHDRPAVRCR